MMSKWRVALLVLCAYSQEAGAAGGDRDEHGCIGSAGYVWCESSQKCLRVWEETCESLQDQVEKLQQQESNFEGGDYQSSMKPLEAEDPTMLVSEKQQVDEPMLVTV